MRVGDLFSGIGGFSLAARWMGWETRWFSEIDPYASAVLAKHWPGVPNLGDITKVDWSAVEPVDLLCGGFPCQDISNAGKRAGIDGERSGLWSEYARAIRELRPRYVVVENVAALLGRGLDRVLGDLSEIGYDAEWEVLSAADVGAPHLRERLWIVAYPDSGRGRSDATRGHDADGSDAGWQKANRLLGAVRCAGGARPMAHAASQRRGEARQHQLHGPAQWIAGSSEALADAHGSGLQGSGHESGTPRRAEAGQPLLGGARDDGHWAVEPDVGRVAHGVPARVDRLRGLGNAIVPQCAYAGPFAWIKAREQGQ